MTLARTSWPPLPHNMEQLSTQQPALAEISTKLGANTNAQAGHAVGGDQVAGEANCAPLNPSGDYGHDHSGGDYGRPLFRSIITAHLGGVEDTSLFLPSPTAVVHDHDNAGANVDSRVGGTLVHLWCPPCDPQAEVGAYAALSLQARAEIEAGTTLIAGDALHLLVAQVTTGAVAEVAIPVGTGVLTSAGFVRLASNARDVCVPMVPGRFNTLVLSTRIRRTGTGSSRGASIRLASIELGVHSV